MIKKLLALVGISLVTLNASAAYVRYDFGGPMSGYFIQLDDAGAIVDFRFNLPIAGAFSTNPDGFMLPFSTNQRGEGSTRITSATTYFRNNGPTNFSLSSNFGGDQFTDLSIDFSRGTQADFAYTTQYNSSIYFTGGFQSFSGTVNGLLSKGTVTPAMAADLDLAASAGELFYAVPTLISPNQVPEPGSLALLGIGVFGVVSSARANRRRRVETETR